MLNWALARAHSELVDMSPQQRRERKETDLAATRLSYLYGRGATWIGRHTPPFNDATRAAEAKRERKRALRLAQAARTGAL